jgi:hypothetical protein
MRRQAFSWLCLGALCALAMGCTDSDEALATGKGMAQVRVDTAMLTFYDITRVSIEAAGVTQDLALDPATEMFTGAILLPEGAYDLVARAYQDSTQVGASNPVPVAVQAGVVTQVTIRILETTGGTQPDYGPIVASLTYPTSAQVGTTVSFAVSVVDPDNDPLTINWSDDCADSTFSAPQAAVTDWSKATQGTCKVTVTATSNGLSATESFTIVVFPAGSSSGAVDVGGVFVSAPVIDLSLTYGNEWCGVSPYSSNASCSRPIASPQYADFTVFVSWGNSGPGSITVSDTCGGAVGIDYQDGYAVAGRWLPPTQAAVCFLSVHAVNSDGVEANLSAAILVRDGTPPVVSPPSVSVDVYHSQGSCSATSNGSPVACGPMYAGDAAYVYVWLNWFDGYPGSVVVTDDCGGANTIAPYASYYWQGDWFVPVQPGTTCTFTVHAANVEGLSSQVDLAFPLL